jgi:hypothetical protein
MKAGLVQVFIAPLGSGSSRQNSQARFAAFGWLGLSGLLALIVPIDLGQAIDGDWRIAQPHIRDALGRMTNTKGEIVWILNLDGGVLSSVRGKLANSGLFPNLSNDCEIVYAGRSKCTPHYTSAHGVIINNTEL